jgi:hypothetical protein
LLTQTSQRLRRPPPPAPGVRHSSCPSPRPPQPPCGAQSSWLAYVYLSTIQSIMDRIHTRLTYGIKASAPGPRPTGGPFPGFPSRPGGFRKFYTRFGLLLRWDFVLTQDSCADGWIPRLPRRFPYVSSLIIPISFERNANLKLTYISHTAAPTGGFRKSPTLYFQLSHY